MYNINRGPRFFVYLLVAAASFVLGWQATAQGILSGAAGVNGDGTHEETSADRVEMDLFWTIWDEIETKYVDEDVLDEKHKVYGSISGLVNSLGDPYTVFMTPEETEDFNASLEGKLEGIGAELSVEEKNLVIVSPLKNSPAERAGLLPGDIVYLIDGELASDMTLFEAIMNIRGEKGTTVVLTLIREGLDEPIEVSIVRDSIDLESVTTEKMDNGIVYLSVNQFNDKTNEQFRAAVSEMLLDEPEGMIVDLRFNGGGYLDISIELLSYLLPADTDAVIIKQRGEDDEIMKTNGNPKILNVPLVVLVNEGSASASEIVAGAIQDHERGVIMGTQTFGKGSVQEVESFSDGSSIRLTVARWYTPDGRGIDEVGLTPDIVVEWPEEEPAAGEDPQKDAAVEYLLEL